MDLDRAENFTYTKKKKMSMMLTFQFLQITLLDTESDTAYTCCHLLQQRSDQINFYQTDFPSMQCLLNLSPELILNLSSLGPGGWVRPVSSLKLFHISPSWNTTANYSKWSSAGRHLQHKYKS